MRPSGASHALRWQPGAARDPALRARISDWSTRAHVNDLLLELAVDTLPEQLVAAERAKHEERLARRAEREAEEAAHRQAEEAFAAALPGMDPAEVQGALDAFFREHHSLDVAIQKQARAIIAAALQTAGDIPAEGEELEPVAA